MIDLGTIPRRFAAWTQFKALVALKGCIYQYEDGAGTYVIYAFDGQEAIFTTIWTGTVPTSIIEGGYSQATNDADKSDFETNFLPTANKGIQATQPTLVGGSDGTVIRVPRVFDVDSGGGTQFALGVSLRKTASGGSVEAGTSSDPLRVDPTGTTTQPVSAASLPLPSGAATSSNQTTLGSQTTKINDGTNTITVKAASTAAVATDQALVVAISPNNTPVLPSGASTSANQTNGTQKTQVVDGSGNVHPSADVATRASYTRLTDGTNTIGTLFNTLYTSPNGDRRTIHNNATITSSGSTTLTWVGHSEWYLLINIKNAPTGTTPTIQFKIDEVDPIDQTTTGFAEGGTRLGAVLNAVGVDVVEIPELISDTIKISWTVTGAGASFTGVNVTFCGHGPGNAIEGQAEVGTLLHDAPIPVAGVDASNLIRTLKVAGDGSLIVAPTGTDKTNGSRAGYVVLGGGTSGSLNAVRATAYNEQSSNAQRSMSSSSASDTSAGTGARTVTITYYDSTGAGPFTETVTLNGTTAVATVSSTICYIESMVVATVGSGGVNVGTITLFVNNSGGGGTIGTIAVGTLVAATGDNRTLWGHHYVATGRTCSVTAIVAGASSTTTFLLKTKAIAANTPESVTASGVFTTANEFTREYGSPLSVVGPARIMLYGVPSTNGVTINGAFDFYE